MAPIIFYVTSKCLWSRKNLSTDTFTKTLYALPIQGTFHTVFPNMFFYKFWKWNKKTLFHFLKIKQKGKRFLRRIGLQHLPENLFCLFWLKFLIFFATHLNKKIERFRDILENIFLNFCCLFLPLFENFETGPLYLPFWEYPIIL